MAFSNVSREVTSAGQGTQTDVLFVASPALRHFSPQARRRNIIIALVTLVALIGGGYFGIQQLQGYQLAQAQLAASKPQTYTAPIPGQMCDTGSAKWSFSPDTSVTCQPNAVQVFAYGEGEVRFFGPGGHLGTRFTVSVQADVSQMYGGCAGVRIRTAEQPQAITFADFYVCDGGTWFLQAFDADNRVIFPASGTVANTNPHTVSVGALGTTETFSLDGKQVATFPDFNLATPVVTPILHGTPTIPNMSYIALIVNAPPESLGYTLFSQFVYTKLPDVSP
jgi:hypothetical protein